MTRPNVNSVESQLREDEGEKLTVYKDSKGLWTLGVGVLVDPSVKGAGITKEESTYLLRNRIDNRVKELANKLTWFRQLDGVRQAVLINMSYQMGVEGLLGFKKAIAAISVGSYHVAAIEMLDSKWAKVDSPNRAERLAKQMQTGVWQ